MCYRTNNAISCEYTNILLDWPDESTSLFTSPYHFYILSSNDKIIKAIVRSSSKVEKSSHMLLRDIKRPRRANNPRLARLTPIILFTITIMLLISTRIPTGYRRLGNRQRDIIKLMHRITPRPRREKVSRAGILHATRMCIPSYPIQSHPR